MYSLWTETHSQDSEPSNTTRHNLVLHFSEVHYPTSFLQAILSNLAHIFRKRLGDVKSNTVSHFDKMANSGGLIVIFPSRAQLLLISTFFFCQIPQWSCYLDNLKLTLLKKLEIHKEELFIFPMIFFSLRIFTNPSQIHPHHFWVLKVDRWCVWCQQVYV